MSTSPEADIPLEIERKFLVKDVSWKDGATLKGIYTQSYIKTESHAAVRFRVAGNEAWLTIKLTVKKIHSHIGMTVNRLLGAALFDYLIVSLSTNYDDSDT